MSLSPPRVCWTITEGHAGTEAQARGLAEALGFIPEPKRVAIRAPWRFLPAQLWWHPLNAIDRTRGDALDPPWPDIVISCGRKGAPLALAVKHACRSRTRAVHVQNPLIDPRRFDVVVAPRHDGLSGPNVIVTRTAIHHVTPAKLAAARERFAPLLMQLPRPLVAAMIGGPNGRYQLTPAVATEIGTRLKSLAVRLGVGIVVTPSRRTGRDNVAALRAALDHPAVMFWDGTGDNPYLGMLALADWLMVTADSVSMTSEAAATGKPIYVIELAGGSRRFKAFHDALRADGVTRPFRGELERWSYAPLNETAVAAAEIRRRFGWAPLEAASTLPAAPTG